MDNRIISKLQKLLALAGSDNEHEAALAMAKAEALMREHNLGLADVDPDGTRATIVDVLIDPTGSATTCPLWESDLACAVAWAFHGRVIHWINARGKCEKLHIVAGQTDMAIIMDLFERLRQMMRRMSAAYVKANGGGYWAGQGYRIGMGRTITERLQALRRNTEPGDEVNTYGMSGKELMVIKDQAVEQRLTELFGYLKKDTRELQAGDESAYLQGREDGKNVSLHRSIPE